MQKTGINTDFNAAVPQIFITMETRKSSDLRDNPICLRCGPQLDVGSSWLSYPKYGPIVDEFFPKIGRKYETILIYIWLASSGVISSFIRGTLNAI